MIGLRPQTRRNITLPLFLMKVPAGPSASAEDYIEDRIDLSEYLAPRPERSFLIRVEGNSMVDAGIYPGDLLIVERESEASNGDVVIALIGGQFTVKLFRRHKGSLSLVQANKSLPDQPQQAFSVWGVVRYSIHKH